MMKRIVVNPKLCNGCRLCSLACSFIKSGKFNQYHTAIWIQSDEEKASAIPQVCHQCLNPVCVKACPAENTWKDKSSYVPPIFVEESTGVIQLDTRKESCLGCRECLSACPFGAIRVIPEDLHLIKCDLCGGDPECVKFCPTGAIRYVEVTRITGKKSA